jgi:hypothetical protein
MLAALLPVFIIILLGYVFKRVGFPGDDFWLAAEKATYFVFFPALLINKLSTADFDPSIALPMAGSLLLSIACLVLFLLAVRSRTSFSGPSFSSVFQGSIRFNTFVGLAAASALLGSTGLTLAAVALVAMIPFINLICVPTVAHFGAGSQTRFSHLLLEIMRNPLILGCAAGFAINLSHLPTPEGLFRVFDLLGRAALPVGLLAVGAGLKLQSLNSHLAGLWTSSALKLGVLPLLTAGFCLLLGVTGQARTVALIFAALPTAVSSFILARQLGGDTSLMASIITVQTVLSAASLPLILDLLT